MDFVSSKATKDQDTSRLTKFIAIQFFRMAEEENQELDEETLKERENAIMGIGKKFRDDGNAKELENMIKMIRPFTKLLSKAKAAKLIRGLVDMYLDMETGVSATRAVQAVELCKECIQWATEEKRIFLRQVTFEILQ